MEIMLKYDDRHDDAFYIGFVNRIIGGAIQDRSDAKELLSNVIAKKINLIDRFIWWTKETKNLLTEKGFGYEKEDLIRRIVLLHSEASELADAIKKGLGDESEGEELADIIIRLCNIPLLLSKEDFLQKESGEHKDSPLPFLAKKDVLSGLIYMIKTAGISEDKFSFVYAMNLLITQIGKSCSGDQNDEWFDDSLTLLALCELYAKTYLPQSLSYYFYSKMAKNYDRPYRYNTDPNLF